MAFHRSIGTNSSENFYEREQSGGGGGGLIFESVSGPRPVGGTLSGVHCQKGLESKSDISTGNIINDLYGNNTILDATPLWYLVLGPTESMQTLVGEGGKRREGRFNPNLALHHMYVWVGYPLDPTHQTNGDKRIPQRKCI